MFTLGLFSKLKFWKKEPEFDFNSNMPNANAFGQGYGMNQDNTGLGADMQNPLGRAPGFGPDPFPSGQENFPQQQGYDSPSAFQQLNEQHPLGQGQAFSQQPSYGQPVLPIQKDIEIISAKIDALRAAVESMNQRIINIESIAKQEQEKQYRARW